MGKWAILSPKIAQPHNSGSAGRTFFKFCTVKEANRQMGMIVIILQKIYFWGGGGEGQIDHFGPKNGASS